MTDYKPCKHGSKDCCGEDGPPIERCVACFQDTAEAGRSYIKNMPKALIVPRYDSAGQPRAVSMDNGIPKCEFCGEDVARCRCHK